MKIVIVIVAIFSFLRSSNAAVAIGHFKDPQYPGKCVVNDVVLSPGKETAHPTECGQMICDEDSLVRFHTCGVEQPPPGYKLGEPLLPSSSFPECCKKALIPLL